MFKDERAHSVAGNVEEIDHDKKWWCGFTWRVDRILAAHFARTAISALPFERATPAKIQRL
jgi:hypothetical protein